MSDEMTKEERAAARAAGLGMHAPDAEAVNGALASLRADREDIERRTTEVLRVGRQLGLSDRALAEVAGLSRPNVKRRIEEEL